MIKKSALVFFLCRLDLIYLEFNFIVLKYSINIFICLWDFCLFLFKGVSDVARFL